MRALRAAILLPVLGLAALSSARADLIDASLYGLTELNGRWAWGQTSWNAIQSAGLVEGDTTTVETLMSDGYAFSAPVTGPINGIYSTFDATRAPLSLVFEFTGGADFLLNGLSFISSQSLSAATILRWDYRLNGGDWQTALSTTTGTLGIGSSGVGNHGFGLGSPVIADAFRFVVQPQANSSSFGLHEITISGQAVIPEPSTYAALAGLAVLALTMSRRRRR